MPKKNDCLIEEKIIYIFLSCVCIMYIDIELIKFQY